MTIRYSIWRVCQTRQSPKGILLESESPLEGVNKATPEILSPEWIVIGRQETTLSLVPDDTLPLSERKRYSTHRAVVSEIQEGPNCAEYLDTENSLVTCGSVFSGLGYS